MSEPDKTTSDEFDEAELLGEGELNVEEFIDSMEGGSAKKAEPAPPERAGWQRVDDWRDARWLREQLNDWDDWKDDDAD